MASVFAQALSRPLLVLTLLSGLVLSASPHATANTSDYVIVSPRDARYFELQNGAPFVPIGLNMIAPPSGHFEVMQQWMENLAANKGNFIRVWLSNPFFDVEHARSGEYDEAKAKRIDQLLSTAARHGIRVKMCLEHFRHFGEGRQSWAAKPLHLVSNGGTASNTADFFDGQASRERFVKKLEWYASRFGQSPTVFGWELWNEVNAVQAGDYLGWTEVMLPELQRLFPRNLGMQSLGSYDSDYGRRSYNRLPLMPGNDVAQVHRYLDLGARYEVCHGPMDVLAADAVRELLKLNPGRPVLLAEGGAVEPSHTGPFKLYPKDREGMLLHDVLFAPFFAGAAGPGHIWHWDSYVARNNLWWHFGRFAEAIKDLDPAGENFEPMMLEHPRLRIYVLKGRRTVLAWCRDKVNTWKSELAEDQAPDPVVDAVVSLEPLAFSGNTRCQLYDPWQNTWSTADISDAKLSLPAFSRSIILRIQRR